MIKMLRTVEFVVRKWDLLAVSCGRDHEAPMDLTDSGLNKLSCVDCQSFSVFRSWFSSETLCGLRGRHEFLTSLLVWLTNIFPFSFLSSFRPYWQVFIRQVRPSRTSLPVCLSVLLAQSLSVFTQFSQVTAEIQHVKSTQLQVKILHSKLKKCQSNRKNVPQVKT